jgi:major membrane immunogen (membrane-anchored lipoprotein)
VIARRCLVIATGVALAAGLAGCGEADKTPVAYEKGKYQGKPDTKPWESAPNSWSNSTWDKGNKVSWENAIKTRNLAQNEYTRTE